MCTVFISEFRRLKEFDPQGHTLISVINVEVGINVEGGIFWKKLVHNSNKRGEEGGKI